MLLFLSTSDLMLNSDLDLENRNFAVTVATLVRRQDRAAAMFIGAEQWVN